MSGLFIDDRLRRRDGPAETISAAPARQTDAVIVAGGRKFTPGVREGEVWCDRCGRAMPAEQARRHRCEG